jgi:hypothetical protein
MAWHSADQAAPAREWLAVTPSDTVNLPAGCRGLFVGGAGNLNLLGADRSNTSLVFTNVAAGTVLPCGPVRVNSTNTTATLIIALY